jgi:hypothetical protein
MYGVKPNMRDEHAAQMVNALYRIAGELNQLNSLLHLNPLQAAAVQKSRQWIPTWAWTALAFLILLLWSVVRSGVSRP